MPWWSWWLIWGGLVLALLGMLAYFGVTLFRKAVAAAADLGELSNALSVLDARLDDIAPKRTPSAVFRDAAEFGAVVERNRNTRILRRQQRHDARLARGKLLIRSAENWTPPHV